MRLTLLKDTSVGVHREITDLSPRMEIVLDGDTGFLYHPEHSHEDNEKVKRLIPDRELRINFSQASKCKYLAKRMTLLEVVIVMGITLSGEQ